MFHQYSSLDFLPVNIFTEESVEDAVVKVPPPSTFEEWLDYNNIESWPVDPEEVNDMSWLNIDIGTIDELSCEVKNNAPFQMNILDDILEEVNCLEEKVNEYAHSFFGEKVARKSVGIKGNEKYRESVAKSFDDRKASNAQKNQESLKARNMDLAVFPGFHPHEMTILPAALEAPQLLNNITRLQNFPHTFRKMWKHFFLSEASVSILQDAFWWVFLHSTKIHKSSSFKEEDNTKTFQSKLFDRMASNFVSLFISVPYQAKDCFFKFYPNCLSQAVYSAFFAAFPLSSSKFDVEFREYLVCLIYEWVSGIRPQEQHVLKSWNLEVLETQNQSSHDCCDEPIQVLKSHLSFDEDTFLDFSGNLNEEIADLCISPTKNKESHPLAGGDQFDKIAFNVFGQGPFIKHFLSSKHLQKEEEILNKVVTRTERNEKKLIGCQTYHDLITTHKKQSKTRRRKYDRLTAQISKDVHQSNVKNKKEVRQMIKLQKEVVKKHDDIKVLSQRIMDLMVNSDSAITGKVFFSTEMK